MSTTPPPHLLFSSFPSAIQNQPEVTFPLLDFPRELIIAVGKAIPAARAADLLNLMVGNHLLHDLLRPVLLDAATKHLIPHGPNLDCFSTVPSWSIENSLPLLRELFERGLPLNSPTLMIEEATGIVAHSYADTDCPLLYQAVSTDNVDAVNLIIEFGGDLLQTFSRTCPWKELDRFETGVIPKMLIEAGIDVNQKWWYRGSTALHYATRLYEGCLSIALPTIQTLVEMGANVDALDDDGWTPLTQVLDHWTSVPPLDFLDSDRDTALRLARILLESSKTLDGAYFLDRAVIAREYEFARLILDTIESKRPRPKNRPVAVPDADTLLVVMIPNPDDAI